ncbi:DUF4328 domain-containing protein [Amycolatopsis sp. K13G38]|uniref:DUF4328 domain-containing protein n=1 Tax=Amycolatopsis acididurans TaxID=2724524 RepID=A0ABX1J1B4_9PSEU|nr:DUF4328 domain-containing protein [Amycolatopsis acididurans]NKQ53568.1 DUF4328 domain-containing protein [Amycolatopsis acididurans]
MSEPLTVDAPGAASGRERVGPVHALALTASTFIAAAALLEVLIAVGNWLTYELIGSYLTEQTTTLADLQRQDTLMSVVNWLDIAAMLAATVAFLCWLWRARVNAGILSTARHRLGQGWVIGGWLCPLLNLVLPYVIVRDIWRAHRPGTGRVLVGCWWLLLVTGTALDRFVRYFELRSPDSLDQVRDGAAHSTVAALLRLGAAVLVLVIIRRVTRWQRSCLDVRVNV